MFDSPHKRLDSMITGIGDVNAIQSVGPYARWPSELAAAPTRVAKLKEQPSIGFEDPHDILRSAQVNPAQAVHGEAR